jgi:hypothetical protein
VERRKQPKIKKGGAAVRRRRRRSFRVRFFLPFLLSKMPPSLAENEGYL